VQREANHTEQRLSLSVQPGLPGTTASTACFVHESAGVGHHDSSQKMATGDQQINGTRRAHLACSAATTSWRQTLLSHGRVEATVTQSAAGRFTRELAKKVTVWKESAEGRELHKTTWLSCLPALGNAKRTPPNEAIFRMWMKVCPAGQLQPHVLRHSRFFSRRQIQWRPSVPILKEACVIRAIILFFSSPLIHL